MKGLGFMLPGYVAAAAYKPPPEPEMTEEASVPYESPEYETVVRAAAKKKTAGFPWKWAFIAGGVILGAKLLKGK